MPPERYTPTQTARHAGISPNTVRLWAKEYREFLSEYANPAAGVDRAFTAGDVAMMQAIAQLRSNNISIADVKERLRQQPPEPLHEVTTDSIGGARNDDTGGQGHLIPLASLESILERSVGTAELRDKLEVVDRRIERIESKRESQLMLIWVALAGVGVGAILVAVVVWLLSIMR
jgi:DNA-binding transcriptional MerR regulator